LHQENKKINKDIVSKLIQKWKKGLQMDEHLIASLPSSQRDEMRQLFGELSARFLFISLN